jgi:hypothetical protein
MKEYPGLKRPSIDYYAFRSLPYAQFQACDLIYAIVNQLMALPSCSDDINVIRHKSRFWLNDLYLAYQGSPSHPLTQALQKLLKISPLAEQDWVNICTAVDMDIDELMLESKEEFQVYAQKLYGSFYQLIATVLNSPPVNLSGLALARASLMLLQAPDRKGVRYLLPDNTPAEVYTLFREAGKGSCKPLALLSRLYQHQAQEAMVHLSPLKTLWLSLRERLYPSS